MDSHTPDDADAYREEYLRRYWAKKNAERARRIKSEKAKYNFFRYLTFPIAVFAIVLIIDGLVSTDVHSEVGIQGWQETFRGKYGSSLHSYMRTRSFVFEVPHDVHLTYPYSEQVRPFFDVHVTPIFHVPVFVEYTQGEFIYSFELPKTIHTIFIPLKWFLLISALYICYAREYSKYTWSLVFMPTVLFLITLVILSFH